MSDLWFTILRWTLLGALVAAVVGVPVVYHQRSVASAFKNGKTVGAAECQAAAAKTAADALKLAQDQLKTEADKAQALQRSLNTSVANNKKLESKLNEALKEAPNNPSCFLPESATGILREFADGKSDVDPSQPIPGRDAGKVS